MNYVNLTLFCDGFVPPERIEREGQSLNLKLFLLIISPNINHNHCIFRRNKKYILEVLCSVGTHPEQKQNSAFIYK